MLPERHVWVFNGIGGSFPSGVFSDRAAAELWIRKNRLSGTLTSYPLDEGVLDWLCRIDVASEGVSKRRDDATFVGQFSSAYQEHYHYENGVRGGE